MIRPQLLSNHTNSPDPAPEPGALLRNTVFEESKCKEAFEPKEKKCGDRCILCYKPELYGDF